jgi:hypothetical protein
MSAEKGELLAGRQLEFGLKESVQFLERLLAV